jgi:hypothetical protein
LLSIFRCGGHTDIGVQDPKDGPDVVEEYYANVLNRDNRA